jgi:ABC-2 type transport system permease protein
MISFTSMWAIVLRHARVWKQDLNVMLAGFYWPLLDILIWGFLGSWIQQSHTAGFHNYEAAALLGILLWQVVGRGCNIMANAFSEELWSNNVVNLFSLPLRTVEWIGGTVLFYVIMMCITVLFCMFVIPILYDVSLWYVLSTFLIFSPPLFFSGVWIGFTCLQIIVTLGKRGVELGNVVGWFLLPFSGAYYPVEVLPSWGQKISAYLPMSYVFQGMRGYVMQQQDPTSYLIKGYALSILYAACAVTLFVYCFNHSKQKGLARLAD